MVTEASSTDEPHMLPRISAPAKQSTSIPDRVWTTWSTFFVVATLGSYLPYAAVAALALDIGLRVFQLPGRFELRKAIRFLGAPFS
jgi:hypothetical protein